MHELQLAFDLHTDFATKKAAGIETLFCAVVAVIKPHLLTTSAYSAAAVAWSGGKDSSVLLALTLEAARQAKREGMPLNPIVIMNADTRIENPLVSKLCRSEQRNIRAFADAHALPVHLITGRPPQSASWAVKVIAANGLPPMPGGKTPCTVDWKITPMEKALKAWKHEAGIQGEIVKLTGTRFSESNERGRKMAVRGESAEQVVTHENGDHMLSPIAQLETDDVWELIGLMRSNARFTSYTDFEDLMAVYSSAGGASCPLVADARMGGERLGSCDARTGCALCTKVDDDTSLANMLDEHPALKPLYALREWVSAIMFDFDKRVWIGRTIDAHGYIRIQPDAIAPEVCMDLLRYACTIDAEQDTRARASGRDRDIDPLVPLDVLTLIDWYWSLYGLVERPYEAWRIWQNVHALGHRYYPPQIEKAPRLPMPETRYLYVGEGWFSAARTTQFAGLRDPLAEALEADTGADYTLRTLKDSREIWDLPEADKLTVDLNSEAFWNAFDFLLPRWIEEAPRGIGHAAAVLRYLEFGMVECRNHAQIDTMCRRAQYRNAHSLSRREDFASVLARSISSKEYLEKTHQTPAQSQIDLGFGFAQAA